MIRVLAIGDVVGKEGCAFLRRHLPGLRQKHSVDMVVANGENSAVGNGILPASAEDLFASGVDVITTGNHVSSVRPITRRVVMEKASAFSTPEVFELRW